ncbi:MAG TPA: MgtC/SapB family protein [Bacteroidia bacterium]|nr:MgtC/SapB family protein [Bacteroidia bacterium]
MSLLNMNSQFYDFIIVTLLSLIIGLEQRRHHNEQEEGSELVFGTDRTFTFIGILGFILYVLDPINKILFIGGGAVISVLLCIFYLKRIEAKKKYGVTSIIAALITYCLAPLIITQPKWFALLIVVTVLILTELKSEFINISKKFDKGEFITLAKFLIIAFIILPNLPKEPLTSSIPISLYNMWLALVVVSGISYFSYLLHKFVLPVGKPTLDFRPGNKLRIDFPYPAVKYFL